MNIDKGMQDGQRITFSGEADQAPGLVPGDIIIVIEEKEHPRFKRRGDDLYYQAKIDLLTALGGGQFAINHLDDRMLIVNITPGEIIRPGELLCRVLAGPSNSSFPPFAGDVKAITGEGMPVYRNPFHKGNLYVKFEVEFPAPGFFTPDRLKALEAALPPREPMPAAVDGIETEEVVLSNVDPMHQERSQYNGGNATDDDEEGGGVQCAQS